MARILSALSATVALLAMAAPPCAEGFARKDRIGGASRLWPLPIPVSLSSSFGEYRDGHIHAGLDLRTHGQEGIECRAVGDGAITRMRASVGGYGKALYLKLVTGETVVYAHLSEFSAPCEEYLWKAQLERGAYRVDLSIPASTFPVREGEIIGYSGSTGSRAPHLHFEVRNVREHPVNPLSRGWKMIDDRAPTAKTVVWIPANAASAVDGRVQPREVALHRTAPGRYSARDTVVITGSAGIGIDAIDRSDERSGKLAPATVELELNGTLIARIERERFSYTQTAEVALEYEMERVRTRGEHFMLLFQRTGETLGGRMFVDGGLICADSPAAAAGNSAAVHLATITLQDKNGNSALITVPFRFQRPGATSQRPRGGVGDELFGFNDYLSYGAGYMLPTADGRFFAPPSGGMARAGADTHGGVVTLADAAGEPVRLLAREHRGNPLLYCLPGSSGEPGHFPLPDIGVVVRVRNGSLFAPAFMLLAAEGAGSREAPEAQGLIPRSDPVFFGPWSLPIRSRIDLDFAIPKGATPRDALYRWIDGASRWSIAPSRVNADTVSASIRRPGIYRVCTDTVPPVIGPPAVRSHTMYATRISYPEIVLAVTDQGAGVDAEKSELLLDGTPVIGRWDPYRKKMFILLRDKNIMGEHSLTVVARDLVGNETRAHTAINFPAASNPNASDGSN